MYDDVNKLKVLPLVAILLLHVQNGTGGSNQLKHHLRTEAVCTCIYNASGTSLLDNAARDDKRWWWIFTDSSSRDSFHMKRVWA